MPRAAALQRRSATKKNGRGGGDGVNYAESDDSDVGTVSDYQESSDDSRCSTPESQKNTVCSVCNIHVSSSDKSLQCDKCNEWCHIKCGNVTKEHYKQMVRLDESNIPINWYCPPCDRLENPEKFKNLDNASSATSNGTTIENAKKTPAVTTNSTPKTTPTATKPNSQPQKTSTPVTQQQKVTSHTTTTKTTANSNGSSSNQVVARTTGSQIIISRTGGNNMPPAVNNKTPNNAANKTSAPPNNLAANRLVFPDVKVRDLPFFPIKAMLLRPCLLKPKDVSQELQQQNLAFYLSPDQANIVNSGRKVEANGMVVYKMHILLRFTKKSGDGVHDDDFPKNLCLKVNNKVCPLPNPKPVPANRPNMESKRPPKPLIITSLCKLNTKSCLNQMSIAWTAVPDNVHAVSVYLVEKLTPIDLLTMLKSRGQRDPEITKALIRSKLEDKEQDEIATTSCKVSMACPLGMARMTYPARSSTCDHLQCFDGDTYLRMNEKKPKWVCPVCNKPAYFENLFLDGFYIALLQSQKFRTCGTNDIVLNQDATWEPVITEGLGVSDDSEDEDPLAIKPAAPAVLPENDPVSQLAKLPIAPAAHTPKAIIHGPNIHTGSINISSLSSSSATGAPTSNAIAANTAASNNSATPTNDYFLADSSLSTEENFTDWNYSVKFFTFIRGVPDKNTTISSHEPAAGVRLPSPPRMVVQQEIITNNKRASSPPMIQTNARTPTAAAAAASATKTVQKSAASAASRQQSAAASKSRGGGGRGGGRGGARGGGRARAANKRSYVEDDEETTEESTGSGGGAASSSAESEASSAAARKKPRGGAAGGRGRGGARGKAAGTASAAQRNSSGGGGAAKKKSRYIESSDEESSESETEVLSRPVITRSGRPSRNCRQSTNYAEIEQSGDVLDYLLEHR